jgi:hypothetical protein
MPFARPLAALALIVLTAGCDDATGVQIADLAGFWNATLFEYDDTTGDQPGFGLDVVGEWDGSATLDIAEDGTFTGSLLIPDVTVDPGTGASGRVAIGGTLSIVDPDSLRFDFNAATEALPGTPLSDFTAAFVLAGPVFSFTADDVMFDFPDAFEQTYLGSSRGAVSARLEARFER